jgi:tol-pal system protein YbgF
MTIKTLISAALVGGTFAFSGLLFAADVPVVKSQADHVATASEAVPLNRVQEVNQADSALIEDLFFRVQTLEETVAQLNDVIDQLTYQVQVLQQEQKERYVDLDKRIQLLTDKVNSGVAVQQLAEPTQQEQLALTDEDILSEFNAAKALMLEKKFDESIAQLAIFAKRYPDHPLAPNAWYWIGEIYLVQRNAENAKPAFERIVADYPDHEKVPDSLYKLGIIAQQASDPAMAKQYFEQVIADFPASQSAKLARARLESN